MPAQGQNDRHRGKKRRPAPRRAAPTEEEIAVLRLVSEQHAVTVGQLARFFGVYRSDMRRVMGEFEARRWVECRPFIAGDDEWVWLRYAGSRLAGTGFEATQPSLLALAHYRAINEARVRVTSQAPTGHWVCERELRRRRYRRADGRLPDAVFEIDDERHAIEVELSRKPVERLRTVIAQHSLRYDAVVYLCSHEVARYMQRQGLSREFPLLMVRPLLDDVRELYADGFGVKPAHDGTSRRSCALARKVTSREVCVLRLLAEQGAIPLDQLARFLKRDGEAVEGVEGEAVEEVMSEFAERGLVRRGSPLVDEPDWVWLTPLGARLSGTGLSAPRPKVGSLPRLRAINEVRLRMPRPLSRGWTSGRVLRRLSGQAGARPAAVIDVDGERHAIELVLVRKDFKRLISRRCADYDVVTFFCAPSVYGRVKRLAQSGRWPNLVVRKLRGAWQVGIGRGSVVRPVRQSQPSRVREVLVEVSPEELSAAALTALQEAHDGLGKGQILSVERRSRHRSREWYRVVTDVGVWKVRPLRAGWHAEGLARRFEVGELRYRSVHEYGGHKGGFAPPTGLRRREFLRYAREHPGETYSVNGYAERFGIQPRVAYRDLCSYVEMGLFARLHTSSSITHYHVYWPVPDFAERLKALEL